MSAYEIQKLWMLCSIFAGSMFFLVNLVLPTDFSCYWMSSAHRTTESLYYKQYSPACEVSSRFWWPKKKYLNSPQPAESIGSMIKVSESCSQFPWLSRIRNFGCQARISVSKFVSPVPSVDAYSQAHPWLAATEGTQALCGGRNPSNTQWVRRLSRLHTAVVVVPEPGPVTAKSLLRLGVKPDRRESLVVGECNYK